MILIRPKRFFGERTVRAVVGYRRHRDQIKRARQSIRKRINTVQRDAACAECHRLFSGSRAQQPGASPSDNRRRPRSPFGTTGLPDNQPRHEEDKALAARLPMPFRLSAFSVARGTDRRNRRGTRCCGTAFVSPPNLKKCDGAAGRPLQPGHYGQAFDLLLQKGLQECVIIPE
jgi:hypothetical protein